MRSAPERRRLAHRALRALAIEGDPSDPEGSTELETLREALRQEIERAADERFRTAQDEVETIRESGDLDALVAKLDSYALGVRVAAGGRRLAFRQTLRQQALWFPTERDAVAGRLEQQRAQSLRDDLRRFVDGFGSDWRSRVLTLDLEQAATPLRSLHDETVHPQYRELIAPWAGGLETCGSSVCGDPGRSRGRPNRGTDADLERRRTGDPGRLRPQRTHLSGEDPQGAGNDHAAAPFLRVRSPETFRQMFETHCDLDETERLDVLRTALLLAVVRHAELYSVLESGLTVYDPQAGWQPLPRQADEGRGYTAVEHALRRLENEGTVDRAALSRFREDFELEHVAETHWTRPWRRSSTATRV